MGVRSLNEDIIRFKFNALLQSLAFETVEHKIEQLKFLKLRFETVAKFRHKTASSSVHMFTSLTFSFLEYQITVTLLQFQMEMKWSLCCHINVRIAYTICGIIIGLFWACVYIFAWKVNIQSVSLVIKLFLFQNWVALATCLVATSFAFETFFFYFSIKKDTILKWKPTTFQILFWMSKFILSEFIAVSLLKFRFTCRFLINWRNDCSHCACCN